MHLPQTTEMPQHNQQFKNQNHWYGHQNSNLCVNRTNALLVICHNLPEITQVERDVAQLIIFDWACIVQCEFLKCKLLPQNSHEWVSAKESSSGLSVLSWMFVIKIGDDLRLPHKNLVPFLTSVALYSTLTPLGFWPMLYRNLT